MAKSTVLVIEDSPTEMRFISKTLQDQGLTVITASDGEEGVLRAAKEVPNLVLLDVVLPKKNGFQICRQLKSAPETKSIKVILVTSKGQETDRTWGLRQGADEYLVKPVTAEDLLAAVKRQLA